MVVQAGVPLPSRVDLPIYRGDNVDAPFRLYSTPDNGVTKNYYDLTGYTGHAQVRRTAGSEVLLELDVAIVLPQTGSDKGKILVTADGDDTEVMPCSCLKWDLELTDPQGGRRTWLRGEADVTCDITIEVLGNLLLDSDGDVLLDSGGLIELDA